MDRLYINRVAIWQPKTLDELSVRASPAGRFYYENGIGKTSDKPMFRYAKNYTIGEPDDEHAIKFCLFIMTFSDAAEAIEQFLDSVAEKIDAGFAQKVIMTSTMSSFEYIDEYYGGSE